jgi:hypothetical protein
MSLFLNAHYLFIDFYLHFFFHMASHVPFSFPFLPVTFLCEFSQISTNLTLVDA